LYQGGAIPPCASHLTNFIIMENSNFKFARKCDVTGQGMNEGWVINQGFHYIKYEEDALVYAQEQGYNTIQELYDACQDERGNSDGFYWTSWDDDEEEWGGYYESPYEDGREAVWVDVS
jgi:hypothetical protein